MDSNELYTSVVGAPSDYDVSAGLDTARVRRGLYSNYVNTFRGKRPFIAAFEAAASGVGSIHKNNRPPIVAHSQMFRYKEIMAELANEYNVNMLGIGFRPALSKRIYHPIHGIYYDLYRAIIKHDHRMLGRVYERFKSKLESINPLTVILLDDASPDGRMFTIAAKELGILTVEVQHGIYQNSNYIPTGRMADHVFVWGEYFKRLYVEHKVRAPETVHVLGYPHDPSIVLGKERKRPVMCYLGTDHEIYMPGAEQWTTDTLGALTRLCKVLDMEFKYRPHPNVEKPKESLERAIANCDVFVSFNSTAMVEAALRNRLCVQLKNFPLPTDDLKVLGVCESFDNVRDLGVYVKGVKDYHKEWTNMDYVAVPAEGPGKRFCNLLDSIMEG